MAFTVIVIVVALTVEVVAQEMLEVNWQSMMSPLTNPGSVYVFALVPTTPLFFFQTYDGEPPPLTGVAVNSTEVPMQIFVPGLATTVTEGVTKPLTVTWDRTGIGRWANTTLHHGPKIGSCSQVTGRIRIRRRNDV